MESRIRARTISTAVGDRPEEPRLTDGAVGATTGTAFGLEIESSFPVAGLLAGGRQEEARGRHQAPRRNARVRIELGSADEIEAAVRGIAAARLRDWRTPDGKIELSIDRHDDAGFRLFGPDFGSYLISADGSHVLCAPGSQQPVWQRMLVGQLLTHVAVLRGMELFHSSALAIAGGAIGIVGFSHTGKTSLALRLALGGALFIADDVIAIDPTDRSIAAHRGVGICNLRHAEAERLTPADRARLGRVIGGDANSLRLVIAPELVAPAGEQLPLAVLYFPKRGCAGDRLVFRRLARPDPTLLLANTFGQSLRMPERLHRQLDLCARVAREIPIFEIEVPASVDAAASADRIAQHASSFIETGGDR